MVADLQPPLDCKKIALLGLCPTYDYVLRILAQSFWLSCSCKMDSSPSHRPGFVPNLLARWAIDPLNSSLSDSPSQEFVTLGW
ncbi:hypothetical protein [Microcoleus sp.]|uniref:hypothetical protein n=1 Tax=Microcoleus sp. TaxID=44472 RepID=UPI00403E8793